eukprot:scaffold187603_cov28-Tisochrysis_lutea.AAC.4
MERRPEGAVGEPRSARVCDPNSLAGEPRQGSCSKLIPTGYTSHLERNNLSRLPVLGFVNLIEGPTANYPQIFVAVDRAQAHPRLGLAKNRCTLISAPKRVVATARLLHADLGRIGFRLNEHMGRRRSRRGRTPSAGAAAPRRCPYRGWS